jgi:8-oxo-dGTP diphosphatase
VRAVTVVHHRNAAGGARIGLVFAAAHQAGWHGEPVNAEPHKCSEIGWFPGDALPADTYPYTAAAVAAWRAGTPLYLSGWTTAAAG